MTRTFSRTAAVVLAGSLLVAGCAGGGGGQGGSERPAHPVFSKDADLQPFAALNATKDAKNASFRQTLTFASPQGTAVLTSTGHMDFTLSRAQATRTWSVAKGVPEDTRKLFLGDSAGGAPATGRRIAVDTQAIRIRPDNAGYWLRYDAQSGGKDITDLRGSSAPYGGTLLESLASTGNVTVRPAAGGGRTYSSKLALNAVSVLLPTAVQPELAALPYEDTNTASVPFTMVVDSTGRVTRADADLSSLLGRKDTPLAPVTSLRASLVLSGHGTSAPAMPGAAERVLDAADVVQRRGDVKPGSCVDFDTGTGSWDQMVVVPCGGAHHGRVYAQRKLSGTYPGDEGAQDKASAACEDAYGSAPASWRRESRERDAYWTAWPSREEWDDGTGRYATCYLVTG
ncbi:hypothetical protein ABT160_46765 [Streptomyces sp. NPDC001941]|uniref:hypothetical protein n=1 Tax=Streptomyces sp. NPDC001941 TaxID=3154659 RepID=UPI003323DB99